MSFQSLINLRNCRVTRNTDVILESIQITAAPVVNRQPAREACLSIKISGCTIGSGVITVTGTVSGVPLVSETFSFSANGTKKGIKEFTFISSITEAGFIGEVTLGNIEIRTVTPTNQPIRQEIPIFSAMPCWVDLRRGGVNIILPGGVVETVSKLFCKHDPLHPLLANDIVHFNDVRYKIDFIEFVYSRSESPHHLELILKRLKAT